jgi:transcriptional regulator with XRE-family HTH domain
MRPGEVFAASLRTARKAAGLTQEAVAAWMTTVGRPLRRDAVVQIERGARKVSIDEAIALSNIVGVPLEEMLTPPTGRHVLVTDNIGLDGPEWRSASRHGDPFADMDDAVRRDIDRQIRELADALERVRKTSGAGAAIRPLVTLEVAVRNARALGL